MYLYLLQETSFEKAYIPLKNKLKIEGVDYSVNEEGIPCCPNDPSLLMKREGSKSHLRCGIPTMKFVCPKMKWEYDKTTKKSINHFKDSFCVAGRKTQNEKTLHADLLLAGITQLITVIVADKIHKHEYLRNLKHLVA